MRNDLTASADVETATASAAGRTCFDLLADRINGQHRALEHLARSVSDAASADALQDLADRTIRHAPRICLVGQVKAGKTMLANALSGSPGLLPVDVNPWTSAITSIHFNQPWRTPKALFRFFSEDDWAHLIEEGGRLGALARRVDMETEAATLQEQVEALRQSAINRLGDKFETLLGRSHGFDAASRDLIQRYVCAGQADAGQQPGLSGRYSEITKTADLVLDIPAYRVPLTICDTPGVNDTFLVREQLTLQSLEDVDVSVIVLSAHQALSSADVGLLRLLTGLRSDQVVLFVNRIDELADPAREAAAIESRMRETLTRYKVATDAEIVFGSAACAEAGMSPNPQERMTPGIVRLVQWRVPDCAGAISPEEAWMASGLPDLLAVIAKRIETGPAGGALNAMAADGLEIARLCHMLTAHEVRAEIGAAELADLLDPLVARVQSALQDIFDLAAKRLSNDLDVEARAFADRECERFEAAVGSKARKSTWAVDTGGLRKALVAGYDLTCGAVAGQVEMLLQETAAELEGIYRTAIGKAPDIQVPGLAPHPAPVSVGGAMAIDAEMPWWRTWFGRRRALEAKKESLRALIVGETRHVTQDLTDRQIAAFASGASATCARFLEAHATTLFDLVGAPSSEARATRLDQAGLVPPAATDASIVGGIEALEALLPAEDARQSAAA